MLQTMKKLLSYTLLIAMLLTQVCGYAAEDMVIYEQSFDSYTGGRFETLNANTGNGSWTAMPSDKFLEAGTDGTNTYMKMVNDSDTTAMSMTYKFSKTVNEGMLVFSYDIAHSGAADTVPRVRVFDESNTERLILFLNAVDSVKKLSGPKPDFKSNVKFEATTVQYRDITAGEPVSVTQVLNFDEDYFETYIDGVLLDRVDTLPFDNVVSWGLYGYNTVSYFDNLSIQTLGALIPTVAVTGTEGGGSAIAITVPDCVTDAALQALTASSIKVSDKNGNTAAVKSVSVEGKTVTAIFSKALDYDTKYTLSLGSLKDKYGRSFGDTEFMSNSEVDENGNTVLRVKQVTGVTLDGTEVELANGVTPEIAQIKIEFNTYLSAFDGGITLNGAVLTGSLSEKVVTADLGKILTGATNYTLVVNENVKSANGTAAKAYSHAFITAEGAWNIKEFRWVTESGNVAQQSDATAGNTLKLVLQIANTTNTDDTVYLTYSAFSGNAQKAVMLLPVTTKGGTYTREELTYTVAESGMELNGILLDDFTVLTPLASSVLAASAAPQGGEATVSVSGSVETGNQAIIANVLAPDKSYDDLLKADSADYRKILVYHRPGTTDEKGNYAFSADMTGMASGLYGVYVTGEEADSLIYTDMTENEQEIDWLTGLTAAPTAEDWELRRAALGFYSDLDVYADVTETINLVYEAVADSVSDTASATEQRNAAMALYQKAAAISALNAGKVTNLMDYAEEMGLQTGELAEFMSLSFVNKETFCADLTSRMSQKNFTTVKSAETALTDAFVLAAVRYPDGYNNLPALLNHFADAMGIEKTVTATIASKISGSNYAAAAGLAEAINTMPDGTSGSGTGTTGGFGGGVSGGGVTSSGYVADTNDSPELKIEQTETTKANEYHVDIFTDLESVPWAREAIVYLAELDIVHGDGNFLFYPEQNVTREEFTKMIVQAFAPNAEEAEIAFADVADGDWFAPYIKKAKGLGIVQGQSETFFGAGQNITRQDMAVIAHNAASMYGISFGETGKNLFEDDAAIADYAKTGVYALKSDGIINGKGNNAFSPLEYATRAEAAKIIYGLLEM